MDEKTIERLIAEAINGVGAAAIYSRAFDYADAIKLEGDKLDAETLLKMQFAVGGFAAGIEFALSNLEITDDGKGETTK